MFLVSLDDFVISKERFIKWSKDVYLSLCYVNKGRKYFQLAKALDTHVLLEMRTFVLEHRVKIIQKFYEHSFKGFVQAFGALGFEECRFGAGGRVNPNQVSKSVPLKEPGD